MSADGKCDLFERVLKKNLKKTHGGTRYRFLKKGEDYAICIKINYTNTMSDFKNHIVDLSLNSVKYISLILKQIFYGCLEFFILTDVRCGIFSLESAFFVISNNYDLLFYFSSCHFPLVVFSCCQSTDFLN